MAFSHRSRTAAPNSTGTQTQITTDPSLRDQANGPVLRLRGERPPRRSIRWAEDVVDNEGLGRKSSKGQCYFWDVKCRLASSLRLVTNQWQTLINIVCCIYHPNRPIGESDDSDSSSSSDSGSESDAERSKGKDRGKRNDRKCEHGDHHNDDHHHHAHDEHGDVATQGSERHQRRRASPNAYEKMPKTRLKKGGGSTVTEVVKQ